MTELFYEIRDRLKFNAIGCYRVFLPLAKNTAFAL